jgi:acyl-coenzyme A synthetase/AMP-(fatty) acid ligase
MNIVELFTRQALAGPDRQALQMGDLSLTYGELYETVRRIAAAFAAAGVSRGDTVAVLAPPVRTVTTTLALAWLGAVSVEVSGERAKVEAVVRRLGVNFLFHGTAQNFAFDHPGAKGQAGLDALLGGAATHPVPAMAAVEPAQAWRIAVSSGTTGQPKGIAFSHGASVTNVNLLRTVYPAAPGDRVLVAMVAAMSFAAHNWLRCLACGACAVFPKPLEVDAVLRAVHELGITHALVTPGTATEMAMRARDAEGANASPPPALHTLSVGGGRLSPQVQELLRRHVCPNLYVHYGAAETHLVAVLDPQTQQRYPQSAGRLLPWVEAQAVDAEGLPLEPGKRGRLRLRVPTLALGYVAPADEQEARAFRDGWFYSNDVGSVSPDGIVRLAGRTNDVINIGGVKVDPETLEDAIQQDPAITDCAVVDVPNSLGQPVLAVVLVAATRDIDVEALRRRCAGVSAVWPRLVMHAKELPRNDAGKIMRGALRKAIAASAEARALGA